MPTSNSISKGKSHPMTFLCSQRGSRSTAQTHLQPQS